MKACGLTPFQENKNLLMVYTAVVMTVGKPLKYTVIAILDGGVPGFFQNWNLRNTRRKEGLVI